LATATDPHGYPSILSFFVGFLVAAGVAGLGYALLAVGAKLLLPDTVRSDAGAYSLSLGTFLVSFFTLSWVAGLNQLSALHDNPAKVAVVLAAVLPLSFLASAGSWQLVNRLPATLGRDRHVALAALLFAGGLSASTLAVVSMNVTGDGTPNLGSAPSDEPTLRSDAPIRRVVLLTVDTLRKDSLTAYNPDGAGTPHIDSLAKDSIFFENAFTSAPWTVPSFVSIITTMTSGIDSPRWRKMSVSSAIGIRSESKTRRATTYSATRSAAASNQRRVGSELGGSQRSFVPSLMLNPERLAGLEPKSKSRGTVLGRTPGSPRDLAGRRHFS
jgi:hypothetical protein